jgi:hypothetical protein
MTPEISDHEMMQELSRQVTAIHTCLLGANHGTNDKGLVGKVDEVCKSHYELKRKFYTLVGILVGSGVVSGSIAGILKLVSG